ncbi:FkbM family methyltransferase [Glaesserella sp.]|uniref:FkbM family methyltransferase n=1 Tax=Glaesserella sp. TaxID=2094731 RepID=UPI0035A05E39
MKTYLKDLRWGKFNLIKGDMISERAAHYGEWAETEVRLLRQLLQPHSTVIEVGANIGMHTVPLAKAVPAGKVLCFEPQRIIYQLLCCNLALNDLVNVESYRQGVSEQNGKAWIESSDYAQPWNYGSFSIDKGFSTEYPFIGNVSKEEIDIIALDDFAPIKRLDSLDLLKIDTEGFDANVLKGAVNTIRRFRPYIFVEFQYDTCDEVLHLLKQENYRVVWAVSLRYQQQNFYQSMPFNELDTHAADTNFLAIPTERIENADSLILSLINGLKDAVSVEDLDNDIPMIYLA